MRHSLFFVAVAMIAIGFPRLVTANDVQIAQQIATQLQAQKDTQQLKGFHIGVKVENGKVWMKGQVSDSKQQHLALDIARRVPGVSLVVNELHIGPSSASPHTQSAPNATLRAALQQPTSAQPLQAGLAVRQPEETAAMWPNIQQPSTMASPRAVPATGATVSHQIQMPHPAMTMASETPNSPISVSSPVPTGSGLAQQAVTVSAVPSLQVSPPAVNPLNAYVEHSPAMTPPPMSTQYPPSSQIPLTGSPLPARPTVTPQHAIASTRQIHAHATPPRPIARVAAHADMIRSMDNGTGAPVAANYHAAGGGIQSAVYDHPSMPGYAWPSYASHPNYAALTYPKQYSPTAWPYIGPFYPYPQVPLGWRKVTLEWDDGWWFLDFKSK